ncbi:MAG: hypothetical protein QGH20_06360 [Candidatus Latescibacteria bacterium]|nr:hypothetical protein [Candidatus Latescibacterota bacterium]
MARRATFLKKHGADGALVVDGGDVIPDATPKGRLQATYLLEAMSKMGYKTVALGPRDFSLGLEFLNEMSENTGIEFTAANVVDSQSGQPVAMTSVVENIGGRSLLGFEWGGVEVGIIGIIDPIMPVNASAGLNLDVTDPVEAVTREVARLGDSVAMTVVLTHQTVEDAEVIATIAGVDVVIISRLARRPDEPVQKRGAAALAWSHYQGRSVGWMDVVLGADGKLQSVIGDLETLRDTIPDDPDMAELVEKYQEALAALTGDDNAE